MPSSSENCTKKWKYDVFLSFRGEDTRNTFVSHLYTFLKFRGIYAFKDDQTLDRGNPISAELLKSIEESRISIIVFSRNYASSTWCLEELTKIMECVQSKGQIPIPVFYHVDPSHVRNQRSSFGEALAKHEANLVGSDDLERVKKWRKALTQAASISGWDVPNTANGNESECIELIVDQIFYSLNHAVSNVEKNLVGMESRVAEVKSLLEMGSEGVCSVGIWGMGGAGKTTVAREIFDLLSGQFEGCCFLANIRETSKKYGLESLQKTLISQILKLNSLNVSSVYEGINMIKARLHFRKVLVVLDDVDNGEQLEYLLGNFDCFGNGSRIITTSRDSHLLSKHDHLYEVHLLSVNEALQLLNWHAFQKVTPPKEFEQLSYQVLHYAKGLPLALKVLGSFLHGRCLIEWISALNRLKDTAEEEIVKQLRISLDGLSPKEKILFLDIACFFRGKKEDEVIGILDSSSFHSKIGISVLTQKSLLYVSNGIIEMHDLIQEMGWYVVREVHNNIPGRWSRLWDKDDIRDVFTENAGTKAIEGMMVPCESESYICKNSKAFRKLSSLRILIVKGDEIGFHEPIADPIDHLPNSLQWLDWSYYRFESLPENFQPRKLVGLNMVSSSMVELWKGFKVFDGLTTINLSWSKNLHRTPDFSGTPNLQRIMLKQCVSLKEVHPSIGYLRKLSLLNMENCKNLEFFPSSIQMQSLEIFNLSGCLKLQNFPEIRGKMDSLSDLRLAHTAIWELTSSVSRLSAISLLDLSSCKELCRLPAYICQLIRLKILILKGCSRLRTLPENLGDLIQLEELYADGTDIWRLPSSISRLSNLTVLSLRRGLEDKCQSSMEKCPCGLLRLKKLDLSGCNLLELNIGDLALLPSLSELNVSRNKFVSLKGIICLSQLQYLNITYCEKLRRLPELPLKLRELYADDFLAKDCSRIVTMGGELHLISFTNSIYEQLYSDKAGDSFLMVDNNKQENEMLRYLLGSVSHIENSWLRESVPSAIVYPEYGIPKGFNYTSKEEKISVDLPENWYSSSFLGWVVCCSAYMGDGVYGPDLSISGNYDYTFIKTKLICKDYKQRVKVMEKRCKMGTASCTYSCCLCIAYIPFYSLWQEDSETGMITNAGQYCLFEASMDLGIASDWGVRLVYRKHEAPEVIALSWKSLLATNGFVCEICGKEFQTDRRLQLHRRKHHSPWKHEKGDDNEVIRKKVYICPEPSCAHHHPSRALGDLTGIRKHFHWEHAEKWRCQKCSRYVVQSVWTAHSITCGTKEFRCDCGAIFSRWDDFITHTILTSHPSLPVNLQF